MTRFAWVRSLCRVSCPGCGAEANLGQRFCGACGTALSAVVPRLRGAARSRPAVLHRVRDVGRGRCCGARGRCSGAHRPRDRAPAVLGAVRGPGRIHAAERGTGSRGGPGAPVAVLRHRPHRGDQVRRHDREVHRRRGDGGLGHSRGRRGRRRACGAGGHGARLRGCRPGSLDRGPWPRGAGRRGDRHGGGHHERRGPGDGRRRRRQHRRAGAVGGHGRHGPGRHHHAAVGRAGHRVRPARRRRAEGQDRAGDVVASPRDRLGHRRRPALGRLGGALRRARPSSSAS